MAILLATSSKPTLIGTGAKDTLYGDSGKNLLSGLGGADTLSGGAGADTLIGGMGADVLHGGAGNDVFKYAAFREIGDSLAVNFDRIVDFSAGDRIDFSALAARSFIGEADFTGTAGEMRISRTFFAGGNTALEIDSDGDGEADAVLQLDGALNLTELIPGSGILVLAENMTRQGDAGNNTLAGGAGKDTLSGLAGHDLLNGGDGSDSLDGGAGDDTLVGGYSADTLTGGAGNDTFRFASLEELRGDSITDFSLGDRLDLSGLGLQFIGEGEFTRTPGEVCFSSTSGVDGKLTVSLSIDPDGDGYSYGQLTLTGVRALAETVKGSGILVAVADKTLSGTTASESLAGDAGWDTINGQAGNDTLAGNGGNDRLDGGTGNDLLTGGSGADTLTGGAGNDTFRYISLDDLGTNLSSSGSDRITDFANGDLISFSAIAGLKWIGDAVFHRVAGEMRTTYSDYSLTGPVTTVEIDTDGNGYADKILQLDGKIALDETAANSRILRFVTGKTVNGTTGADTLIGSLGNDTIDGRSGNDSISAGEGNDVITGGAGADTMSGGNGADSFVFRNADLSIPAVQDQITDFMSGTDKIDLSQIDANTALAGDQAFTLLMSGAAFTGTAGQLRLVTGIGTPVIEGDVNGDKIADFKITASIYYPTSSDFIL
ncbi:M10 family metallopeptidase C-terminal domain-containing protein [Roseicella aquatilis]|uniref:Peptidase M10 serralysin C-terminal domain-containing protein n=1 Tax=Roseicella aquatilis TaxID=2527868 RepID=A0A4R4DGF2_9PROT|nr:M10 family metallopeptidase C-terminal domain-containing protein [Roseicella aquatilis]TCZ58607.1 hypothetical protein EXY23_16870 [Roseicella aquatilis]